MKTDRFDLKALRRDRDQLWAEAAEREAKGESIRLDEKPYKTSRSMEVSMRRSSTHEVGNVYAKAIPTLPRESWQEWELVKITESDHEPPHAEAPKRSGEKPLRTFSL